jgi:CRISPR-associated protein Csb3
MSIRINVDPTNPGQFFACCGLLELADRLWGYAEGWFDTGAFLISTDHAGASLSKLLEAAKSCRLLEDASANAPSPEDGDEEEDDSEDTAGSLSVVSPIAIELDWWKDKSIKTWAGSMKESKIFLAMCNAIDPQSADPLNQSGLVFDASSPKLPHAKTNSGKNGKKREPFYFDARRGASAWSIDVGFSTDALGLSTTAHPVVEALCFIGLQRCRPKPTPRPRVFHYFAWRIPLPPSIVPVAVSGAIGGGDCYCFTNTFRTDQKKHKTYTTATRTKRNSL